MLLCDVQIGVGNYLFDSSDISGCNRCGIEGIKSGIAYQTVVAAIAGPEQLKLPDWRIGIAIWPAIAEGYRGCLFIADAIVLQVVGSIQRDIHGNTDSSQVINEDLHQVQIRGAVATQVVVNPLG